MWAIARPDTRVVLIEPLLRRSTFLSEAVADLGLADRVTVWRGRAEDAAGSAEVGPLDVVTARAVAPLERLIGWTVPLLAEGGRLVALKGSSARQELADGHAAAVGCRTDRPRGAGGRQPVSSIRRPRSSSGSGVRHNDAVTTTGAQVIQSVGLGWPDVTMDVSRETTPATPEDVSRETAAAGLGWPT